MKAQKYTVTVQTDPVHSYMGRVINEIYIPSFNIVFNDQGYVFSYNMARPDVITEMQEIDIPDRLAEILLDYVHHTDKIKKITAVWFPKDV